MNFRRDLLKKVAATLCAGVMAVSSVVTSVGAVDTSEAEIKYSLMYLDRLPKEGSEDFNTCSEVIDPSNLKNYREDEIRHLDRNAEKIKMNEHEVYAQIEKTVQSLIDKVDERTPGHIKYKGNPSKNLDKSREWRIAKAIYRWVAKHIHYDWESLEMFCRRPQDALLTYKRRMGECAGKSDLTALMMRMAKIPSVYIGTITSVEGIRHAYNAVYLPSKNNSNKKEWILLDTTWETEEIDSGRNRDTDEINDVVKAKIKEFFPAFYNNKNLDFKSANEDLLRQCIHKIHEVKNCDEDNDKYNKIKYNFQIDGCKYEMAGQEGTAFINMDRVGATYEDVRDNKLVTSVSSDIANLGMKINIGSNITSLVLAGNETIDLSKAENLKNVDVTRSSKYGIRNFMLYEKDTDNVLRVLNTCGETSEGIPYSMSLDYTKTKVNDIYFGLFGFGFKSFNGKDVRLPEFLTTFDMSIKIGRGVHTLILDKNDNVDLSCASDLTSIDVTDSKRYEKRNDKLFDKVENKEILLRDGINIIDNRSK